ncbi:FAD-dependent oxidoreductase [Aggregatilinea lenta]|uniref:FAD-dependent oxidoreductase n=1 Tax=Aggregatilinea lenta TaxID=913108 RepID=UPI000E5AE3C1|nr:FAD-dependent oxidoreductase [Aggregatilinea lenta]
MDEFDVVIVGAGPAGATAAYLCANAGLSVVVIERGQQPGSKNVSGGLIYAQIYDEIFPNFWKDAPVERTITGHSVVFLGDTAATALDYRAEASAPHYNAFSVLRAKFDPWLAAQAEAAGAMVMPGFTVDELIVENGRVCGVKAGGDELRAQVVVVAEGTRSQLLKQAGLREAYSPKDVSIGIKEIIQLPEQTITDRFQCLSADEGAAYTLVGHTGGVQGGGFIYSNRDTLSLGVVAKIDSVYKSKKQPHEILDEFKSHPFVARLIHGGEVVEYSAQTVHRGGFHLIPQLYGDGYVVAGSAARLLLNNVMTLRGMDVAVASAAAAAKAVIEASGKGDFSAAGLASYEEYFKATSVYKDMQTFKNVYPLLENDRLFSTYPDMVCAIMEDMFSVQLQPGKKGYRALRDRMKDHDVSLLNLAKDVYQIGRGVAL